MVEDCQRNRPATPFPNTFMITRAVFTTGRNPCSRSAGADVHDRLERVFTISWNTHEEPYLAAMALQLLEQQDLMDVVARQTIRRGDDHQIEAAGGGPVAQAIETRPPQRGATVAVIAKDMVERHVPALLARVARQAFDLLLDRLGLRLALRRYPGIVRRLRFSGQSDKLSADRSKGA